MPWRWSVLRSYKRCRDRNYFWHILGGSWHLMVTTLRLESSLASLSLARAALRWPAVRGGVVARVVPFELAVLFRPTTWTNFVVAATAAAITWPCPLAIEELLAGGFCTSWLEESRRFESDVCLLLTDCKEKRLLINTK